MAVSELKDAVKELWYWQYGTNPTNFTSVLYTLIAKADLGNKARLETAFPMECEAFDLWQEAPDADEFFNSFKVHSR